MALEQKEKTVLLAVIAAGLLATMLTTRETMAEQVRSDLGLFDERDIQDVLDRVRSRAGGQKLMQERFWERTARHLPSRSFITLFRM